MIDINWKYIFESKTSKFEWKKVKAKTTWSLVNSSDGKILTQLLNKAVNYPLISLVCYYPWHEISLTKDALKKLKLIRAETIRAFLCHTEWKHWWSTQQIFSKWKWQFDKFFRCHKEVYQVKYISFIVYETEIWVAIYLLAYYMWSNGFLISKNLEWDVIRRFKEIVETVHAWQVSWHFVFSCLLVFIYMQFLIYYLAL